jgi:dTDP-4-amino-4,6-dideoxygalactose transaminase
VILPSFTFVSTANAFALRGSKIAFADIHRETMNLDESQLESLITPRTKAIVPVHYAGVACNMQEIGSIARKHGVKVVEDNAHGLFARYQGRYTGTFGCLAAQSFHETKNFTCGEGGALVVNDPDLVERAQIIREKGTNRNQFFRGMVDKYTWVDLGSSYLPSDLLAAFLSAQLEARQAIQAKRKKIWEQYAQELGEWGATNGVQIPIVPPDREQAYHMFYLLLPSLERRQALMRHIKEQGILSVFHYVPLHTSDMGLKCAALRAHCPVTEDVSKRLLRLPFFTGLTVEDQARIIAAVRAFSVLSVCA